MAPTQWQCECVEKDAFGVPVATGSTPFTVTAGQSVNLNLNIAIHFTGGSNSPTHFDAGGDFVQYFRARGGVATFGYAISRTFLFQGLPMQVFQRAVLQKWPDGSVHLLNLLDPGFMPFTSFNGSIVPAYDLGLVSQAPSPGSANYSAQVIASINANVPDVFMGQPVNFRQTFFSTVTAASAFPPIPPPSYCQQRGLPVSSCTPPPGYGDLSLLPGFDLEIWGVPTSAPILDPSNSQFVYQRFQRGIMHYQGNVGVTEGLLLGQYFKSILTGQDLPADLAQEAANKPLPAPVLPGRSAPGLPSRRIGSGHDGLDRGV